MTSSTKELRPARQFGQNELLKHYVQENYKTGDRLPSDKVLSAKLGISRYATLKALDELSGAGLIRREQGRGTFVARSSKVREKTTFAQVAFLADEFETGFIIEVMRGVEAYYRSTPITLSLLNNNFDHEREIDYLRQLQEPPYSGAIVLCSGHDASLQELRHLHDAGFPLVTVDRHFASLDCPSVEADHEKLAYDAVRYLLELGHRKIAYFTLDDLARKRLSPVQNREDGYRRALEEADIPGYPEYLQKIEGVLDERASPSTLFTSSYVAMHKVLSLPDPPTAVLLLNEVLAPGAYRATINHRLKVPDDVSLFCVSGDSPVESVPISLTRTVQPGRKIGAVAAELVERLIRKEEIADRGIRLEAELVVGDSTASPKKEEGNWTTSYQDKEKKS